MSTNEAAVRARAVRRTPSLPEGLLWQVLRARPGGYKFRRQHPLGLYVVDFYCAAAGLVIEVDGEAHGGGGDPGRDARRDRRMEEQGLRVLRFTAPEVMRDLEPAVTAIMGACREVPPHRRMGRGTARRVEG